MNVPAAMAETACRVAGDCEVTQVLAPGVVRVRHAQGGELIVKRHASRAKYEREVRAYRQWTPALGSRAPRLTATDAASMTIAITVLPGRPCTDSDPAAVHHAAGTLLRQFHEADAPRELSWFGGWLGDRARYWARQARDLLTDADAAVIGTHLAALAATGISRGGPCHLDFQPRNWLLGDDGNLALIDFEHARISLPARDFVRLQFRTWAARPGHRDAFFNGYGRRLSAAENDLVCHLGALDALTALARGHQRGDAALTAAARATISLLRDRR